MDMKANYSVFLRSNVNCFSRRTLHKRRNIEECSDTVKALLILDVI
jgi:hypothetical protein